MTRTSSISRTSGGWARIALAVVGTIGGLIASAAPAQASNTLEIAGTAQATSSAGTSIVTGDTFGWSYTVNLDSTASAGSFNNAVTAFTLTAGSGNVGTWSPAGVNWVISPVLNLVTNPNSDQLTLQVQATNAPAIDGVAFLDLGITLAWPAGVVDIQPVTGSETLGATLGTMSPDLQAATYFFELRDVNYTSAGFTAAPAQPQAGASSSSSATSPPAWSLQQFGKPGMGTCDEAASASLNLSGVASGGWAESWGRWDGYEGPVCTRALVYSNALARWTVN